MRTIPRRPTSLLWNVSIRTSVSPSQLKSFKSLRHIIIPSLCKYVCFPAVQAVRPSPLKLLRNVLIPSIFICVRIPAVRHPLCNVRVVRPSPFKSLKPVRDAVNLSLYMNVRIPRRSTPSLEISSTSIGSLSTYAIYSIAYFSEAIRLNQLIISTNLSDLINFASWPNQPS